MPFLQSINIHRHINHLYLRLVTSMQHTRKTVKKSDSTLIGTMELQRISFQALNVSIEQAIKHFKHVGTGLHC